jgi:endonuclease/exonuclease/phosphatase family metal-dependent hydrolase
VRVVSYNIRFGGARRVAYLGRVLAELQPDVVLLQEATNPSVVDRLAGILDLPHALRRPGWSVAALLREEPRGHRWHRPPGLRGFLEVEPSIQGADVRLVNAHLAAGLSQRGERARLRQVEDLVAWQGGGADDRTLLVGDLNSVGQGDIPLVAGMPFWIRVLVRFDGGIRTQVLDRLAEAGWFDAYRHLHPDDPGFTMPAGAPRVRLDYVMAPRALLPRIASCEPVDSPIAALASDHLPLLTVIDG